MSFSEVFLGGLLSSRARLRFPRWTQFWNYQAPVRRAICSERQTVDYTLSHKRAQAIPPSISRGFSRLFFHWKSLRRIGWEIVSLREISPLGFGALGVVGMYRASSRAAGAAEFGFCASSSHAEGVVSGFVLQAASEWP